MAVDVLHVDDRVIDQQAEGEHQGEQGHPVDGIAEPVVHHQGQGVDDGDGDGDDQRLPPAEGEEDQRQHGDDGDQQVADQLVHLVVGGLAVVAGDPHLHVVGDDRPLHAVHRGDDIVGHVDRIGPLLLGDGDVHRLIFPAGRSGGGIGGRAEADARIGVGLGHAVGHLGDVPQVDRPTAIDPDHQVGRLPRRGEKGAAAHQDLAVVAIEAAGRQLQVGCLQGAADIGRGKAAGGQGLGPQVDADLPRDGRR